MGWGISSREEAQLFAHQILTLENAFAIIAAHKGAFNFVFRELNGALFHSTQISKWTLAKDLAHEIISRPNPMQTLGIYRKAFHYISQDEYGLKWNQWAPCHQFAKKVAFSPNGINALKLHKEAFNSMFPRRSLLDAWTYANKHSGLE
jgi:hypothetical protein